MLLIVIIIPGRPWLGTSWSRGVARSGAQWMTCGPASKNRTLWYVSIYVFLLSY